MLKIVKNWLSQNANCDLAVFDELLRRRLRRSRFYRKLKERIIEAHEPSCRFRKGSFHCNRSIPLNDLHSSNLSSSIRAISTLNFKDVEIVSLLSSEPRLKHVDFNSDRGKMALLISSGWKKSGIDDAVECHYCGRTVGLWLFRNKKQFNVEQQHYKWCGHTFDIDSDYQKIMKFITLKKLCEKKPAKAEFDARLCRVCKRNKV
ncbi:unnamed protein product [Dracunculus medinensis]|uniref:Rsm1 domain-containing protein n=1 Tax=Dracunculus medinensis TaxID=318479 RepID=A0A0N4U3K9_DRAME|nr:unnamed protein product [Dracunculus medinensis]